MTERRTPEHDDERKTRLPATAFFSTTMPLAGEASVTVRCGASAPSMRAISAAETSQ